jgi:hypothetical protein
VAEKARSKPSRLLHKTPYVIFSLAHLTFSKNPNESDDDVPQRRSNQLLPPSYPSSYSS